MSAAPTHHQRRNLATARCYFFDLSPRRRPSASNAAASRFTGSSPRTMIVGSANLVYHRFVFGFGLISHPKQARSYTLLLRLPNQPRKIDGEPHLGNAA